MVLLKNKKGASLGLFGFFFILTIFVAVFFFGSILMHYVLYDYGISTIVDSVASPLLNSTGESMTNINNLSTSYLGNNQYYDILFLVLIISAFIQSTLGSMKAKEEGFMTFFGMVTLGNIFLIFILSYGLQIQGWIFNEIIYNVLTYNVETPIITFFINYGMYVMVSWYLWLIAVNQINFDGIKDKISSLFSSNRDYNRGDDSFLDQQLEELER